MTIWALTNEKGIRLKANNQQLMAKNLYLNILYMSLFLFIYFLSIERDSRVIEVGIRQNIQICWSHRQFDGLAFAGLQILNTQ